MKITKEWLNKRGACTEGVNWFLDQKETEGIKLVEKLIKEQIDWANWLVVRLMNHVQQVRYAVYASEQVLHLFEKKYPKDKRPREAIEAVRRWLADPNETTRKAADAAYSAAKAAAYDAAYAADAAYSAAKAAAYAAAYAADAAYSAAKAAAYSAAKAAAYDAADVAAAYAADYAAKAAAKAELKEKIIQYGIKILKTKEAL